MFLLCIKATDLFWQPKYDPLVDYILMTFNVIFRPMCVRCSDWLHVVLKQAQVWYFFSPSPPQQATKITDLFITVLWRLRFSPKPKDEIYQSIYFWTNEVIKMWRLYCNSTLNDSGQVYVDVPYFSPGHFIHLPFLRLTHQSFNLKLFFSLSFFSSCFWNV